MADPYIDSVSSLLHFNGSDGSSEFDDATLKNWTVFGNAQIDTAQSKFGGSSAQFTGHGDYVVCNSYPADFGSGDFTVEFWAKIPASRTSQYPFPVSNNSYYTAGAWLIGCDTIGSPNVASVWIYSYSAVVVAISGSININDGAWHHIALTRSGTTIRLFVDGTLDGSVTLSGAISESAEKIYLSSPNSIYYYIGHIDELRVTIGVARYTSSFTPESTEFEDPSVSVQYLVTDESIAPFFVPGWLPLSPSQYIIGRAAIDLGVSARNIPLYEPASEWMTAPISGTISGVVTEGGVPVPFAKVHCYFRNSGEKIAGATCDESGNFTIVGLDPTTPADPDDGKYFVVALDPAGGSRYNALIYDRVVPS